MKNLLARLCLAVFLIASFPVAAQRAFVLTQASVTIAATTTTASAALTLPSPAPRNMTVRVYNSGTTAAFVSFGAGSAAAVVATSYPVPAGGTAVVTVPEGTTHAAAIMGAGTASVTFTAGEGLGSGG